MTTLLSLALLAGSLISDPTGSLPISEGFRAGSVAPKPVLSWDSSLSLKYAADWCNAGNDCPDGQFTGINTDCTHFVSHALDKGGVVVRGIDDGHCQKGLSIRVKDLESWFSDAAKTYQNVSSIAYVDAQKGDFVFLEGFRWRDFEFGIRHVMIVGGPVTASGSLVYGHTNNRCGNEVVDYNPANAKFYRITSNALDGTWRSTDATKRFGLEIKGIRATFTEYKASGAASLSRVLTIGNVSPDGSVISRKVDDEVLKFLDFPNAGLRAAILATNPHDSTFTLTLDGAKLTGAWKGLLVKKKPDGSLDQVVPHSQVPAKAFEFTRV